MAAPAAACHALGGEVPGLDTDGGLVTFASLVLSLVLAVAPGAGAGSAAAEPRDPFVPLSSSVSSDGSVSWRHLQLTGLVSTPTGPLAVLQGGPGEQALFVRPGATIGRASVWRIDVGRGVVILREPAQTISGHLDV